MGRIKTWTTRQEALIRKLYPFNAPEVVAAKIGKTKDAVKARAQLLGVKKDPKAKFGRHLWTKDEIKYLRSKYRNTKSEDIATYLGVPVLAIYHKAHKLGLKKSAKFLLAQNKAIGARLANSEAGIASRFPKGHTPENKGKKWTEYLSPEMQARSRATTFKKGNLPQNTLYDGAIRFRHDHPDRGKGRKVYFIRLAKGKWLEMNRYTWEQANGPIPKGMLIAYKDGNSENYALSNLEMITMKENRFRNAPAQRLPDSYVAHIITTKSRKPDRAAAKEVLEKHPELIKTKRTQLLLNKKLKQNVKEKGRKSNRDQRAAR
ncbi:MAG: hypothetical protein JWO03_904 [Bacteroidetes bacterium]|nr:hypothetical protein [Bacteroidota bacterium]